MVFFCLLFLWLLKNQSSAKNHQFHKCYIPLAEERKELEMFSHTTLLVVGVFPIRISILYFL